MIKWFFLLTSFLFAAPIQDRRLDLDAVTELSFALHTGPKQWQRPIGQERWEMTELPPEQRHLVFEWAKKQGFFDSWEPVVQTYDKALLFGATTPRMQKRLNHLKELWEKGIRFKEVVFLTGERPLDRFVDQFLDCCKTESEAAQVIWKETDLPEEMKNLPTLFVAVPMLESRRPNTLDTLSAWLKLEPEPCTALFISDQPFCGYQFALVKEILSIDGFSFDFAAAPIDLIQHPAGAAILLDAVARWTFLLEQ